MRDKTAAPPPRGGPSRAEITGTSGGETQEIQMQTIFEHSRLRKAGNERTFELRLDPLLEPQVIRAV